MSRSAEPQLAPLDLEIALEHLRMGPAGPVAALAPGRRGGARTGGGIDFAAYRPYSPGDDFRTIDWTLYARLGRPFCRQLHVESALDVHILLDVSDSMRFGQPDKLDFARWIARALAFVGLRDMDRVGLATFSDRLLRVVAARRSRRHLFTLSAAIEDGPVGGRTDFDSALRAFGIGLRGGGLAVILSDFLSPAGFAEGLSFLLHKKVAVVAVEILAPQEVDPRPGDDVELIDAEDPSLPPLAASARAVADYRRNLERRRGELERFCLRHRVALLRLDSSSSFADVVGALVRLGLWRRVG